ncbi:ABC transporter ATP-binding protein [Archangium primigenium]|uniref:ABC transporter ATP-binding protein n=1 Tax=[Archangium] primigenium TaxID=2792470 RepID=UPI0019568500|nr:ABC transporter ATP-binding protein [Archangium primigenium]MBM7119085.1 ABC transporter ATP-binding protein [Archangium primigenium]
MHRVRQGIELDGITRVVGGETHLSDIHLRLEPGSFQVLLGRTRAGKTSLLRLLAGLDAPTAGRLRVDGQDVTHVDVRRRDVAMVYQQFVNYPSLTVYENIASPLRLAGKLDAKALDKRVRDTAAALRLDPFLQRLPAELSGGQQQRTAMARALAKDASLLLLDEPLANLDYKLREELRTEIRQLFRGRPAVVVYATTEPTEALLLGGQTVVLHEGRVLQAGPTLEVYQRPANEQVGQVFSDPQMNLWDAEITPDGRARLSSDVDFPLTGHLRGLTPGRYRLGLRAHHLGLAPASAEDIRVPAHVELEEVSGSETLVHAGHAGLALAAQLEGVHRHPSGAPVTLFIPPSRLFAFTPGGPLVAAPPFASQEAAHGPH